MRNQVLEQGFSVWDAGKRDVNRNGVVAMDHPEETMLANRKR
jgi:hypothetical protein